MVVVEASPMVSNTMWNPVEATHHNIRYGFSFLKIQEGGFDLFCT